jgi:hypothetical protein
MFFSVGWSGLKYQTQYNTTHTGKPNAANNSAMLLDFKKPAPTHQGQLI